MREEWHFITLNWVHAFPVRGGEHIGSVGAFRVWPLMAAVLVVGALLSVAAARTTREVTFELEDFSDTYLSSSHPDAVEDASPELMVTSDGGSQNWTVISFTPVATLRTQDTVVRASLEVSAVASTADLWPVSLRSKRVLLSGPEPRVTWHLPPAIACEVGVLSVVDHPLIQGSLVSFDMTSQLRDWQSEGGPPYLGIMVQLNGRSQAASFAFASREHLVLVGPRLVVTVAVEPSLVSSILFEPAAPSVLKSCTL